MSAKKKRSLEDIQKDLDAARKVKREKRIECRQFKYELRDHPDTIRTFIRKLKLPEHLITELVDTEKLFRFYTIHDENVDRESVGAGTAEIRLEEWDCNVLLDGMEDGAKGNMSASRWTGQPWEVHGFKQLDGDSDDVASMKDEESLWKLALSENDGDTARAFASIAFLRFGGW